MRGPGFTLAVGRVLFACALLFAVALARADAPDAPATVWTMLDVTPARAQADCHLLDFPDGTRVLVDVGEAADAPPTIVPYFRQRGITHVDLVVISHGHPDHYGRLRDLIESGVTIGRVAINLPADRKIADREIPWGMNWEQVQELIAFLHAKNIPTFTAKAGDVLVNLQDAGGAPVRLEVIAAYDGVHTPVGETSVNDTSIVMRLTHGTVRALFTGDLDIALGSWMAQSNLDLRADILKVPHHGGGGHPPDAFYDRVGATAALVPMAGSQWHSPWCSRMRDYLTAHAIPTWVSGIDGRVTVRLTRDAFFVSSAVDPVEKRHLPRAR